MVVATAAAAATMVAASEAPVVVVVAPVGRRPTPRPSSPAAWTTIFRSRAYHRFAETTKSLKLFDSRLFSATVEPLRGPFAPGFAAEQNMSKGSHQRPLCPFWSTRSVGVPAHRIAPGRLGRIERDIGFAEQVFGRTAGVQGHPDRGA